MMSDLQRVIRAKQMDDAAALNLSGTILGDDSFDWLITDDADVYKEDGSPLLIFRKKVLKGKDCVAAFENLRTAAASSDNRGSAGGNEFDMSTPGIERIGTRTHTRYRTAKADGTLSNSNRAAPVQSGIVGYFDRNPRYPYCRLTAFNLNQPKKFNAALPVIRAIDRLFAAELPERYAAQREVVERTSPDFFISGTVFTTITVNMNFQTAVHKDVGDYAPGFGTLTALRAGKFDGCYLCMPQYRIAVDLQTSDVLLMDVHEWHGNTPLYPRGDYERLSLVCYYREAMQECGSHTEELSRAKRRQPGTPMHDKRRDKNS